MKMMNKNKRLLCFIASLIVSIGIPLVVTVVHYDMLNLFISQKTSIKISIIGAVIVLTLLLIFFKKIIKYLSSLEFSISIAVLKGLIKLIPLFLVLFLLANMTKVIDDFVFVFSWITGCNVVAKLVLDPLTDFYTEEVRKDNQREIVRSALDETA
jgi:hypothetical protein